MEINGAKYVGVDPPSSATRPVRLVEGRYETSMDRMERITEHGTKEGYDAGCRGSHCPGRERLGMSCEEAKIRFARDMSYRRRVEAGMSPEAIAAEDALDAEHDAAAVKVAPRTHMDAPTISVADSVEPLGDLGAIVDDQVDEVAAEPVIGALGISEPSSTTPEKPRVVKWSVRRVWVAFAPDGTMHGPFDGQPDAVTFVGSQFAGVAPAPATRPARRAETQPRRRITEEDRATMRTLHSEGLSTTKIAQATGRALSVVGRELLAMGLKANGKPFGGRA